MGEEYRPVGLVSTVRSVCPCVPDLFDLVSQPESAHQIEAQLENLSLENMSQALHLERAGFERLRELLNQVRLQGIGFPVNESHHDESLGQLLS